MVLFVKHTGPGQVEVVDGPRPQPAEGELLVHIFHSYVHHEAIQVGLTLQYSG